MQNALIIYSMINQTPQTPTNFSIEHDGEHPLISCTLEWLGPLTGRYKGWTFPVNMTNTMAVDTLAPCVARLSAAMVLTLWDR